MIGLSSMAGKRRGRVIAGIIRGGRPRSGLPGRRRLLVDQAREGLTGRHRRRHGGLRRVRRRVVTGTGTRTRRVERSTRGGNCSSNRRSNCRSNCRTKLGVTRGIVRRRGNGLGRTGRSYRGFTGRGRRSLQGFTVGLTRVLVGGRLSISTSAVAGVLTPIFVRLRGPSRVVVIETGTYCGRPLVSQLSGVRGRIPGLHCSILRSRNLRPCAIGVRSGRSFVAISVGRSLRGFLGDLNRRGRRS